ncbi:amidohydrolase-domain-containing protein [Phellopilus nigrolimitatus]|nr:amidohydrolase-domain-containing protein [Phellopilus nigrolimitatus]
MTSGDYQELYRAAFTFPAIDNHTHPLLSASHKDDFAFEGLISEAQGPALTNDAIRTLACFRATRQLSTLLGCANDWESVKETRSSLDYMELCKLCLQSTSIQCFLLDDGLDSEGLCEDVKWHDQFSSSPSKQIVRIEIVAQNILKEHIQNHMPVSINTASSLLSVFSTAFDNALTEAAQDPFVAGFKSIACYRTGLDIFPSSAPLEDIEEALMLAMTRYGQSGKLRLADKHFNDYLVRITMVIAGKYQKPVQFHTGLGDSDIALARSSPAHLQPLVSAFPDTPVVLLHASYPFTREAGYLASVYRNVYLDFGEVFPFVSKEGQRNVVRQVLELCPTNKMLWSTDGHWWPETYYLGTLQAREVLYEVLAESVRHEEITEQQAVGIVRRALFENSNSLYNLGLDPVARLSEKGAEE